MNNFLISNYHTHTYRCNHASQSREEEYVLRAIENGIRTLGFSDHSTYIFNTPFYSAHRMKNEQITDYVSTLKALREKYKDKIKIHIGFEVEYYPDSWDRSFEHWRDNGIEYLILGQHYVGCEEWGAKSIFKPGIDEDDLKSYVSLVCEGIRTGKVSYLAHPDAIYFTKDMDLYKKEMRKLVECALECKLPLEYNLLGVSRGNVYPKTEFWELVREYGAEVIIGCDAHHVSGIADPYAIEYAKNHLSRIGITNIINDLQFKKL